MQGQGFVQSHASIGVDGNPCQRVLARLNERMRRPRIKLQFGRSFRAEIEFLSQAVSRRGFGRTNLFNLYGRDFPAQTFA